MLVVEGLGRDVGHRVGDLQLLFPVLEELVSLVHHGVDLVEVDLLADSLAGEPLGQDAGVGEIRGLVLLLHETEEVGGPHERARDQSIEHIESDDFRRLGCLLVFRGLHDEHLSNPYAQQSNKRVPRDGARG